MINTPEFWYKKDFNLEIRSVLYQNFGVLIIIQ